MAGSFRWKDFRWPDDLAERMTILIDAKGDPREFRWVLKHFGACKGGYRTWGTSSLITAWHECRNPYDLIWWLSRLQYMGIGDYGVTTTPREIQLLVNAVMAEIPTRSRRQTEVRIRCAIIKGLFTCLGARRSLDG